MSAPFYRAFEDRHRGSRELIKGRLEIYLPFIDNLKQIYSVCHVIDVGCGRGEWLELLIEQGVEATGIDQDAGMLEACQSLDLPAEQADALQYLKGMPDESVVAVTGFHIAEHIPFEQLQTLIHEALRVLKPAGLLILETPNAENLTVGTHIFYLDPTHERPIPQPLLSFLTEHTGFSRSKILRLQEAPHLRDAQDVGLLQVLEGVSPDYAVVAQKKGNEEHLALFDALFDKNYGVSLQSLAKRFDSRWETLARDMVMQEEKIDSRIKSENADFFEKVELLEKRIEELESGFSHQNNLQPLITKNIELEQYKWDLEKKLDDANQVCAEKERHLSQLQAYVHSIEEEKSAYQNELEKNKIELGRTQKQLNESLGNAHNWYLRASEAENNINAFLKSRSWRLTWPLRMAVKGFHKALKLPLYISKKILYTTINLAFKSSRLSFRLKNAIVRFPRIYNALRKFYKTGFAESDSLFDEPGSGSANVKHQSALSSNVESSSLQLKPIARKVFMKIEAEIKEEERK